MAKKTNKTSHVMDLLTNGASSEVSEPSNAGGSSPEPAANQEKKAEVQSHTVTPKKVTVVDKGSRDDRVSQEILNNLTQELEKETGKSSNQETEPAMETEVPAAAEPVPAPTVEEIPTVPEEIPTMEVPTPAASAPAMEEGLPASVEEVPAQTASETAPPPAETPSASVPPADSQHLQDVPVDSLGPGPSAIQELESQKSVSNGVTMKVSSNKLISEHLVNSDLEDGQYRFVNVMELLLLRQNIPLLLKQHGVCSCERCMADVCALTLTGLPSKYVVTNKDSISPIVSFYENKFKIPLLTEFMKACSKVREKPRHRK